jgi:hypothetical protein
MKPVASMLVALAALMVLTLWGAAFVTVFKLENKELAAWAQAIGTVGAIFVTAHYATKQISAQDRMRREEKIDLLEAIQQAADYSMDRFHLIELSLQSFNVDELRITLHTSEHFHAEVFDHFLAMPAERWPSAFVYLRAQQFARAQRAFLKTVRAVATLSQPTEIEWRRMLGEWSILTSGKHFFDGACEARIAQLA